MDADELPAGLQPVAETEYVTEYEPGLETDKSITPDVGLTVKPAADEKVPPEVEPATRKGDGLTPLIQTGLVYEKPVTGDTEALIAMGDELLPAGAHP